MINKIKELEKKIVEQQKAIRKLEIDNDYRKADKLIAEIATDELFNLSTYEVGTYLSEEEDNHIDFFTTEIFDFQRRFELDDKEELNEYELRFTR